MDYNYHAHTALCGHATGTQEEYVQRAIACGIQRMGFSEHFPLKHPNGGEASWRVPVSETDSYREETMRLREKYKGQIKIFLGFEMEYFPELFESMLANAISYGAEYLILGQHYIAPEYTGAKQVFAANSDHGAFRTYVDLVIDAMKTGVFSYVAHPDVFHYADDDRHFYREECRRLCAASRELGVPLELNFLGIRQKRSYPCAPFWEVAGEERAPVTFGFDSHDVLAAYDGESLRAAEEMVLRYGLHYIGEASLRFLKDLLR